MACDCTYLLNPSVFYQAVTQKSSCCAYFSEISFSVLSHTLQQAIPQFAALWPERFIYGDALDDGFSVMHRLRMLLFRLFVKSFFLFHGINPPLLIWIQKGIGGYSVWKNYRKFWKVYPVSGLRIHIYRSSFFDGPAEYGKTLGLFSLSARFAYSNSKLTFVIFRSWQSWWRFRSPFPRYAQNLGFWLSGSTWMCSQPNVYGLSGVASQL